MPNRQIHAQRSRCSFETLESRCLLAADIVINEIHYDPPDKTEFSEYIELYNNTQQQVDLSSWSFTDGIEFDFPSGTTINAGEYLVVAQDPVTVEAAFGVQAYGPWSGTLKNSGERIQLQDASGVVVDEVDYKRGFPWPTVGEEPGHSIELINPNLENDVGGNWRKTGLADAEDSTLVRRGDTWRYFPGTTNPSTPASAWRDVAFDDTDWAQGTAPIGYGDNHVATTVDMQGNYSSLFLRKTFEVDSAASLDSLILKVQFDDGFHMWINGEPVLRQNASASTAITATAASALENFDFVEFELGNARDILITGQNVITVQLLNASLGGSSDAWFDAELKVGASGEHSAGIRNHAYQDNAPPATRQVNHGDDEIRSDQDVVVTAKITDDSGVQDVTLEYQVVEPGDYFGRYLKANSDGSPVLNPRYDDPREWTALSMNDAGQGGDGEANDDIFSVTIPSSVQQHRHLVRYRIRVQDQLGAEAQVPYADDPQHNFAYFVYDDVPDWTAADRPGRTPEQTYQFDQFNSIATYHLLTTAEDHQESQHIPNTNTASYSGSEYLWPGTMIYDGEVYDNISYRARGGVWRYAMGKNMWKFDFNRGHGFQARNDYGEAYSESWDKLNFSALIQQGNYLHRGEQGLFESVGFKLFNLAGVESPNTHYVHFRVVDTEAEVTNDQFTGDFQGLYLAIEQPDGRMLEEHGLPDGNLYKIENHRGDSNNQGKTQVSDGSDVSAFISAYRNGTPSPEWWEANLDLDRYYSYRTIVDGIHHYDIAYGKNYFYYHNPETGKFQVHPWDLDLTWANNMFGSGDHDFLNMVARNDAFEIDYQNRVRELRDLLFNQEQTGMLIDEFAAIVDRPDELSWVDADRAMWDFNPIMRSSYVNSSKSGQGRFYDQAATNDFPGMKQIMKDYVDTRSDFLDRAQRVTERRAPETPSVRYTGNADFAVNRLTFASSEYDDPNNSTFSGMEWRVAEITDPNAADFGVTAPMYEITSTYESGELRSVEDWTIPANELRDGSLYRVRARMKNAEGIWSHWSEPVQFIASPAIAGSTANSLRISEIHYNPADPSRAELDAGFTDSDDFEFIELVNIGSTPIDLSDTSLQRIQLDGEEQGVAFEFPAGQQLAPGEHILVVEDVDAFQLRYGFDLPVAGAWAGKLGNGGEFLTLIDDGTAIHEFAYDDAWFESTDGDGYSLEVVAPLVSDVSNWGLQNNWQASNEVGGTPGTSSPGTSSTALVADFDLDDAVTFADFLILSANFGNESATRNEGDANGDATVDFADFLLLSANFGKTRD